MIYTESRTKYFISFIIFFLPIISWGQTISIEGQILGGNPLKGVAEAHIFCENADECQTVTDSTGKFKMQVPSNTNYVFISHQSFEDQIIKGPFKNDIKNKIVILQEKVFELGPIEISAKPPDSYHKDLTQKLDIISARDVKSLNATNTADVLEANPNIFIQRTQGGGGSPILRGLEANKVLLMVDGIRMNNAIYRGRHVHNVLLLDESVLKQMDVIYGPSSSLYGSDALGGTIHIKTKDPIIGKINEKPNTFGNYYVKTTSASNELSTHADLNIGFCNWASLSSITYKTFGDSKKGKIKNIGLGDVNYYTVSQIVGDTIRDKIEANQNRYIQKRTDHSQLSAIQKFKIRLNSNVNYTANFQFNSMEKVNRFDKLQLNIDSTSAKYAEWYYDPYSRFMFGNTLEIKKSSSFYDHIYINMAYQKIHEGRVIRKFKNPIRLKERDILDIYNFNTHFIKSDLGRKKHQLNYGIEFIAEQIASEGYEEQIVSLKETRVSGRYPNGSTFRHGGAYINFNINQKKNLLINTGMRINYSDLNVAFDQDSYNSFYETISTTQQSSFAPSGNFGILSKFNDLKIRYNISSGFRTPNLDDLAKLGEGAGFIYEVPNSNIKPEYIINSDFEISYYKPNENSSTTISLNPYYSYLFNAIVRAPTTFLDSAFHFDGQDKYYYYSKANTGYAYIYGTSLKLDYTDIRNSWKITGGVSYTQGWDVSGNEPLTGIPPLKGIFGVKKTGTTFHMGLNIIYNAAKKINQMSNVELNDNRIPATGNPNWIIYNLSTAWIISDKSRLNFIIENLFDVNYRVFSSGINASGRNFNATYYFSF